MIQRRGMDAAAIAAETARAVNEYHGLVAVLRAGRWVPAAAITATLAAAIRTPADLIADVYGRPWPLSAGDPCPNCGEKLRRYRTVCRPGRIVRYLACWCGWHGKNVQTIRGELLPDPGKRVADRHPLVGIMTPEDRIAASNL